MADAAPSQHVELHHLRAVVAKWQQRVPRITEMLRRRSEALALAESENRALRREIAVLRAQTSEPTPAPSGGRARAAADANDDGSLELDNAMFERTRLERELQSLQTRNGWLVDLLEILTARFERANAELLSLRRHAPQNVPAVESVDPEAPAVDGQHRLLKIRGVGAKSLQALLASGIRDLDELASLDGGVLNDPASPLHAHRARIRRERWVEQAQALTAATKGGRV